MYFNLSISHIFNNSFSPFLYFPQVYNWSCTNTEMPTHKRNHICFCIYNVLGNLGICILFSAIPLLFWEVGSANARQFWKYVLISSHRTCLNTKNGGEGHQAARITHFLNLISPSNLPICSATITGCSISFKNKRPTFDLKLLQRGDDVPTYIRSLSTSDLVMFAFFSPGSLTEGVTRQPCPVRAGKGWREEVGELASGCWHSCCAGLISLRTLHAFCLYWAQRAC